MTTETQQQVWARLREAMPVEALYALPTVVGIDLAGRAFGLGPDRARRLAREGAFPVEVLRLGQEYKVTRASLLALLDPEGTGRPAVGRANGSGEPPDPHATAPSPLVGAPSPDNGSAGAGEGTGNRLPDQPDQPDHPPELPPNVRAMLTPRLLGVLALARTQAWRVSRFDVIAVVGGKAAADGAINRWLKKGLIRRVGAGLYRVTSEGRRLLVAGEQGREQ